MTNGHGSSPVGSRFQASARLAGSEIGVVSVSTRPLPSGRSSKAGWPLEYDTSTPASLAKEPNCQCRKIGSPSQGTVPAKGRNLANSGC